MSIIDFQKAKQERTPHATGKAMCMACAHEWTAVAPTGTVHLDCPSCHLEKGYFVGPHLIGTDVWTCNCGNTLFKINPQGIYCPHCGSWQVIP